MGFEINVIPLLKLKDIYFEPWGSKAKKLGEKLNSKPIFFSKTFYAFSTYQKQKLFLTLIISIIFIQCHL